MNALIRLLISAIAVIIGAYLLPGVEVDGFLSAFWVAIIIALMNTFLRPILVFLTIPVTFITLGLFLLVIDALIILLAGNLISGFQVNGFWPALIFSLIISLISWILTRKK